MTPRRNQNTGSRLRNKARTANITADKSNVQIAVQCAHYTRSESLNFGPSHSRKRFCYLLAFRRRIESHRQKVTLSLDKDLYKEVKLQAVRENRDVSTITEDLYRGIKKRKTT